MLKKLVLAFLVFLLLVVAHHLYGEYFLFKDGFELKLAYGAAGAAALTLLLLVAYAKWRNRKALGLCQFLIIVGWGFGVGVYDGGYNHLMLNIMALNGAGSELRAAMFVRPVTGDYLFEATGILQFIFAVPLAAYMRRLVIEDQEMRKQQRRQAMMQTPKAPQSRSAPSNGGAPAKDTQRPVAAGS